MAADLINPAVKRPSSLVWLQKTAAEPQKRIKASPCTQEELSKHSCEEDCWISFRSVVYDVTEYLDWHPGGKDKILEHGGGDITKQFMEAHPYVNLEMLLSRLRVGPLLGEDLKRG